MGDVGDGASAMPHWGAWEGSQLPAPLSAASSLPEKDFSAEPCQLGDFGNCLSASPLLALPCFAPGEGWGGSLCAM